MSKKSTKIAIASMMALSIVPGVVAPVEAADPSTPVDEFNVVKFKSYVRILNYLGDSEHVVIPKEIDNLPVTIANISDTNVKTIDASQATELKTLTLRDNEIENLNVTGLTELQTLYIENNNLSTVDLTTLTGLKTLNTYGNPFDDVTRSLLPGFANETVRDRTAPKVTIMSDNGSTLAQGAEIPVQIEDDYEVTKIEYAWTTSNQAPSAWETFSGQRLNGTALENIKIQVPNQEGTYYLHVRAYDIKDNVSSITTTNQSIKVVYPLNVLFSKQSATEPAKFHEVQYSLTMPADSVTYGWSNSRTTPPTQFITGSPEDTVRTPGESGTHYLWVKAKAGANEYTFKTNGFTVDTTAPVLIVKPSKVTSNGTVNSMKVAVDVSDNSSGIAELKYTIGEQPVEYFASNGSTIVNKQFEVYKNGTYTVYAKDKAGNATVRTFTVREFDGTKPVISITPNGNLTPAVSHKVEVDATDDTKLVKLEYAWAQTTEMPGASEFKTISPKTVVETPAGARGNYYLHVKATDDQNNVSTFISSRYVVDGVATDRPGIALVDDSWTNDGAYVAVTPPEGSTKVEYRVGEAGLWTTYEGPFKVTENGKVYARAYNQANVLSPVQEFEVSVIDKIKPTVGLSVNTAPTIAKSHTTTVIATDNVALSRVEYAWSTSKTATNLAFTPTTNGAKISTPSGVEGNYYLHLRGVDHVGNITTFVSEVFRVNDVVQGAPTFKADQTNPTNKDVKLEVTYPVDAVKREYRIGAFGEWVPYSGPITVKDNAEVYARSYNNVNVVSPIGKYEVTNIDRMNPIITLSQVKNESPKQAHDVKVTVLDNTAVSKVQYAWGTSNKTSPLSFETIESGSTIATPTDSGVYYLWVKADDVANNTSSTVSGGFLVATTPPALDVVYSTKNPTTGKVTLSVTPADSKLGAKTIKFAEGSRNLSYFTTQGQDITHNRKVEISRNGVYTFYVEDLIGNKSVQQVVVSNIDTNTSVADLSQNGNPIYATSHTTTIYVTDDLGVGEILYGWSTSSTKEPESYQHAVNGQTVTTPPAGEIYYLWIKTKDRAGNKDVFVSNAFNTMAEDLGEVPTCDTDAKSCDTVLLIDGDTVTVKTTIEGPATYAKVKSTHISYEIPFEKKANMWEITVSYDMKKGNNLVSLDVIADGRPVTAFKKPILVSVRDYDFKYVGRYTEVDKRLYATPHRQYAGEGIQFHVYTTNHDYKLYHENKTFTDIANNFARYEITQLANRHIILGTTPTTFSPNANITRGQFAAILGRSLGQIASGTTPFTDIKGNIFEEEITLLYSLDLVAGVSDTKFDVNATLTREQAVTILSRVLDYYDYKGLPTHSVKFIDADKVSPYAVKSVNRLAGLGVINGMPDGSFDPKGKVTRAQMAKMLWRVHELIELY